MADREQTISRQHWLITQVQAVCPITGMSFLTPIAAQYAAGATVQQKADAQAIIDAFDVNAPTPAEQRLTAFVADPTRADWVTHLLNDALAPLETYVRTAINADGAINLATSQACLKRIETAIVRIAFVLALNAQK